jgi:type II secretory pathway pseudopilin PulG
MMITFKKIIPYLIVAIISILISGIVASKLDFLSGKERRELKKENERLEKENQKLIESAKKSVESSEKWKKIAQQRKDTINIKQKELDFSREYNIIIRQKIDSLDIPLYISDSTLAKIDKQIYETLNDSSSSDINEHYEFFTEWLNIRKK